MGRDMGSEETKMATTEKKTAVYGIVELNNGLILEWLRFVEAGLGAKAEAVRIVTAQHVHVAKCCAI